MKEECVMREISRRRLSCALVLAMAILALSPQIGTVAALPSQMVLYAGTVTEIPLSMAVSAGIDSPGDVIANLERDNQGDGSTLQLTAGQAGEAQVTFRLLGILPVRTVAVSVEPERVLIPGGQSVGVALQTEGVVVVGSSDLGVTPSPARVAGLKTGDVIKRVNGQAIHNASELTQYLSDGQTAHFEVQRGNEILEYDIAPTQDERDGVWRLGAWVRDSTAGVGTMTFYDPESAQYGALGHAITDVDTGVLMPVGEGAIYENNVVSIHPSQEGTPGELTGDFFCTDHVLGSVTLNSDFGIFGASDAPVSNALYPEGLPAASRSEIEEGPATLLTTLDGGEVQEYDCEVVRLADKAEPATRSMIIRITDPELIAQTGGIVQGMSGSPLIQNGKIIGAVTHVMVNDPTMGYGISIEAMLDAADAAETANTADAASAA